MAQANWQVLIVEDDPDSLQVVAQALQYRGIQVHSANDGRECLEMLKRLAPDLIVMDLALPAMDGWQALKMIRENPTTAHIPVVAVTAYHSASVAEDAVQAGFDAYFPKPINVARFVDSLVEMITES